MVVNHQVPHSIRPSRLSRKQIAMIRELLSIDERKQLKHSTNSSGVQTFSIPTDT